MSNIIKKGIAVLKSPKKRTIILAQHGFFKNMSDEEFLKMQFGIMMCSTAWMFSTH